MKHSNKFMGLKEDMRYCAKRAARAKAAANLIAECRMAGYYCGLIDQALDDNVITREESFTLDRYYILVKRYYYNKMKRED